MEIHSLEQLEALGEHGQVQKFLSQARQAQNPQLWKYASGYFVRQGIAGKALEYYSLYLNSTAASERDGEAVSLAIDCAHRLDRHRLVCDYFMALTVGERAALSDKTLTQVCRALIQAGRTDEAERVVSFLRQRHALPQLPDFDSVIASRFGSGNAVLDFIARTSESSQSHSADDSIRHAMNLALAHIAQGNYQKAERILLLCKTRIAA